MQKLFLAFILSSSLLVSGCLPIILGGVATAGYIAAQERGVKTALSDISIKTHIKDRLTGKYYKYLTEVEVSVLNGNVLLTGVVESSDALVEVESIVRSVKEVKDVYNELFSDGFYPSSQYSKDAWMATELKSLMLADKRVTLPNYHVLVVNSHAYIFGLSGSKNETAVVLHLARTTKGVKQVHNYIKPYKPVPLLSKETLYTPSVESEELIEE